MILQFIDVQFIDVQLIDFYFDFFCFYVWCGVEMVYVLCGSGEGFCLWYFLLVQGNYLQNKDQEMVQWWLIDQLLGVEGGSGYMKYQCFSLNVFLVVYVVVCQGEEKSWVFVFVLFWLYYEDKWDFDEVVFQDVVI